MTRFLTSYPVGDKSYCSHVFARDMEHAREVVALRNIGEQVEGICPDEQEAPPFPIDLISRAHTACFLSWVAVKSGLIEEADPLGDKGIVHEYIHILYGDTSITVHEIDAQLNRLMELVPGYLPPLRTDAAPWESASAGIEAAKPVPAVIGGTERSEPSTHATAVIRRDAQEQPTEGKHPSSVKGIVEEIIDELRAAYFEWGKDYDITFGPNAKMSSPGLDARLHARLTALLSPPPSKTTSERPHGMTGNRTGIPYTPPPDQPH